MKGSGKVKLFHSFTAVYDKCRTTEKLTEEQLFAIICAERFPCGAPVLRDDKISFPSSQRFPLKIVIAGKTIRPRADGCTARLTAQDKKSLSSLIQTVTAIIANALERFGKLA